MEGELVVTALLGRHYRDPLPWLFELVCVTCMGTVKGIEQDVSRGQGPGFHF